MTKTFKHSYQMQKGKNASEMATRRNRTHRCVPSGPDIMCLPNNEWGYFLFTLKEIHGYLREEYEVCTGLTESDNAWIRDRLIEANMLIDLIEGPEFRRGYNDWVESVSEELELIYEKQSPTLL